MGKKRNIRSEKWVVWLFFRLEKCVVLRKFPLKNDGEYTKTHWKNNIEIQKVTEKITEKYCKVV